LKLTKRDFVTALIAMIAAGAVSLGLIETDEADDLTTCTTAALEGGGQIWSTQACEDIAGRLLESIRDELGEAWIDDRLTLPRRAGRSGRRAGRRAGRGNNRAVKALAVAIIIIWSVGWFSARSQRLDCHAHRPGRAPASRSRRQTTGSTGQPTPRYAPRAR